MFKAYLEPNAISWSRRSRWSGAELRSRLESRGLDAHFGIHGIYELARAFLSDERETIAAQNFQILAELEPVFDPTPEKNAQHQKQAHAAAGEARPLGRRRHLELHSGSGGRREGDHQRLELGSDA